MRADASFKVRVTGILLENDRILLVKQRMSASREWSLPGGTVEVGETLTEIEVGSQLMRQEGVHAGMDRAPVRRNVRNVTLVVILRCSLTAS